MPLKFIISGFLTVVLALAGLGVWGWYASDESRVEVARALAAQRLERFCEQAHGVEFLADSIVGFQAPPGPPGPPDVIGPDGQPATSTSIVDPPENVVPSTSAAPTTYTTEMFYPEPYYYGVDLQYLAENAPAGMADEIQILRDAEDEYFNTGSPDVFTDPKVVAATGRVLEFAQQTCR